MKQLSKENYPAITTMLIFLILTSLHFLGKYKLYIEVSHFDKFMHFSVGCWMSGLIYLVLKKIYGQKITKSLLYLSVFSILVTIGVFWEFYEFLKDTFITKDPNLFSQTSIADTMADLLFDMLGSLLFILAIMARNYFKKPL